MPKREIVSASTFVTSFERPDGTKVRVYNNTELVLRFGQKSARALELFLNANSALSNPHISPTLSAAERRQNETKRKTWAAKFRKLTGVSAYDVVEAQKSEK